jgi:hypothetical protein
MKARKRTIISLDDELHRRAKSYAAEHGTTLTALVEEAAPLRQSQSRGQSGVAERMDSRVRLTGC